jgi:hypothetical protein
MNYLSIVFVLCVCSICVLFIVLCYLCLLNCAVAVMGHLFVNSAHS